MIYIFLGYPIALWLGFLTLISFTLQMGLGYYLTHGYPSLFIWHKVNAGILFVLVITHALLALSLYL